MSDIIIGIIGMVLIVVAFILDEFLPSFNQETIYYNGTNILGSLLLIYYALSLQAWPFVFLNVIWLLTASYKIVCICHDKSGKRHLRRK